LEYEYKYENHARDFNIRNANPFYHKLSNTTYVHVLDIRPLKNILYTRYSHLRGRLMSKSKKHCTQKLYDYMYIAEKH